MSTHRTKQIEALESIRAAAEAIDRAAVQIVDSGSIYYRVPADLLINQNKRLQSYAALNPPAAKGEGELIYTNSDAARALVALDGYAAAMFDWVHNEERQQGRDRFTAACAAIQSVSCGIIAEQKNRGTAAESLAEAAVEMADALLRALAPQPAKAVNAILAMRSCSRLTIFR